MMNSDEVMKSYSYSTKILQLINQVKGIEYLIQLKRMNTSTKHQSTESSVS